ncbi:hypothetical protein INS49_009691 [Diaporthe citri]|uniref:uncharacterized protein n=1 Tax=Diaporthe citri TaxID=83186 RepID=UPI001C7F47AD|nr:uncharacterized protein INS49_009691 [Diaporthe citri]KAG6361464.1 hypothetical protein INS49_009691 [Diaporthe citri]
MQNTAIHSISSSMGACFEGIDIDSRLTPLPGIDVDWRLTPLPVIDMIPGKALIHEWVLRYSEGAIVSVE